MNRVNDWPRGFRWHAGSWNAVTIWLISTRRPRCLLHQIAFCNEPGGGGGTWVKACWVCAAGLPEPLPPPRSLSIYVSTLHWMRNLLSFSPPPSPVHMCTHINFMLHVCGCKYEPFHFSKDLYWLNEVLECSITRLKLQSNAHSVQMTLYPCQREPSW